MSTPIDLRAKVDDYLSERHRLGFELRNMALVLASFVSYVESHWRTRANGAGGQ
jgi:hypothetical protein